MFAGTQPISANYWHRRARHVASSEPVASEREANEEVCDMALPAAESQGSRGDVATAIAVLRQRFGDRLQTGAEIRRQHANVITWIPNQPPAAALWAKTGEE